MKTTLVGYTGFVGSNLAAVHEFTNCYNSKNITQSFGVDNGLVVYSGMASQKYLANANPAADLALAKQAMDNIQAMKPEKLVLISTVDVYPNPAAVYEDTPAGGSHAPAYGAHRLELEKWVREAYPTALIMRLPGLFGQGLKKNFIYDMLTIIPAALPCEKWDELSEVSPLVQASYVAGTAGFYKLKPLAHAQLAKLKAFYLANSFNALSFTDSRSEFQFYNLARLWKDIEACLKEELPLVNLGVEPVEASALYSAVFGKPFVNHTAKGSVHYDMRTRFASRFGGRDGYLATAQQVTAEVAAFAKGWQAKNQL